MKIHKLTYLLVFLVLTTFGFTFGRHPQSPVDPAKEIEYRKQLQARSQRFPTADYEEKELADPKKNQARKEKKLRKNNVRLVARNPRSWSAEVVVISEGAMEFPALPVAESTFIILAKVTGAEAHVSENKKNIYSEFKVIVEKVFKTASNTVFEGTEITIDRTGGFVRYPNGQSVLYRLSNTNMPLTGERYVFFLTSENQQDFSILTAYELGHNGVAPLDEFSQFEQYRGVSETSLIQSLREALAKSSPY